ncbi:unnamed protein product [Amoebophrya sp. A25]|nr:unnamed protein product [Amoebophrya sp. A25]|eukprot:GSA25T00010143001.1
MLRNDRRYSRAESEHGSLEELTKAILIMSSHHLVRPPPINSDNYDFSLVLEVISRSGNIL